MIEVKVRYAGLPRSEAGKQEEIWIVEEGGTLSRLVEEIKRKYGWNLVDRSYYIIVYNHHGQNSNEWETQELKDGDLIQIISSISGG